MCSTVKYIVGCHSSGSMLLHREILRLHRKIFWLLFVNILAVLFLCHASQQNKTKNWLPKITLNFKLWYCQQAKGWKTGKWNERAETKSNKKLKKKMTTCWSIGFQVWWLALHLQKLEKWVGSIFLAKKKKKKISNYTKKTELHSYDIFLKSQAIDHISN